MVYHLHGHSRNDCNSDSLRHILLRNWSREDFLQKILHCSDVLNCNLTSCERNLIRLMVFPPICWPSDSWDQYIEYPGLNLSGCYLKSGSECKRFFNLGSEYNDFNWMYVCCLYYGDYVLCRVVFAHSLRWGWIICITYWCNQRV